MGLDVYVIKFLEDRSITLKVEAECQKREKAAIASECKKLKVTEGELPREAWDRILAKTKVNEEELGLHHGCAKYERISIPSKKHKDHYWNLGYFRSSYNSSGFNSFLRGQINKDLYTIFGGEFQDMPYEFQPDWSAVRTRAVETYEEFKQHIEKNGRFETVAVDFNPYMKFPADFPITDNNKALEAFQAERAGNKPCGLGDYSNRVGQFYFENQLKVHALDFFFFHGYELQ